MTFDTNVAVYALTDGEKRVRAREAVSGSDFASVQVLNEYAWTATRKFRRSWPAIRRDLVLLRDLVPNIRSIDEQANPTAVRLAERYQLSFFDALMLAVALTSGARTIYSEDMHHGMVIDETLRIVDPFR